MKGGKEVMPKFQPLRVGSASAAALEEQRKEVMNYVSKRNPHCNRQHQQQGMPEKKDLPSRSRSSSSSSSSSSSDESTEAEARAPEGSLPGRGRAVRRPFGCFVVRRNNEGHPRCRGFSPSRPTAVSSFESSPSAGLVRPFADGGGRGPAAAGAFFYSQVGGDRGGKRRRSVGSGGRQPRRKPRRRSVGPERRREVYGAQAGLSQRRHRLDPQVQGRRRPLQRHPSAGGRRSGRAGLRPLRHERA
mmetsp:Transcript_34170/g.109710  ORF Transcript_34170/g.109710 Transcript_34170/m.109710 type:complete len:245 (-) Transcript_34170:789-1523(-)